MLRLFQDPRKDIDDTLIRLRIFDSDAHSKMPKAWTQRGEITKEEIVALTFLTNG